MEEVKTALVDKLPGCDICKQEGKKEPAVYDCKTTFGPWANLCEPHYIKYGAKPLGLGQCLNTMEFLLAKRPKEEIIRYFLKAVDALMTVEKLADFSETVAVYVHSCEILKGNARIMDFKEPFRSKIQEVVSKARAK